MDEQEQMTGFCGYNCQSCAARSEDPRIRQKLVDGWRKFFGHQHYTSKNVKCSGCRGNDGIADKGCEVRPCAQEKKVASCTDCSEYPCGKLKKLAGTRDGMLFFCYPNTAELSEEEYNLCMKQFTSMPVLIKQMIKKKLLPAWLRKYYP